MVGDFPFFWRKGGLKKIGQLAFLVELLKPARQAVSIVLVWSSAFLGIEFEAKCRVCLGEDRFAFRWGPAIEGPVMNRGELAGELVNPGQTGVCAGGNTSRHIEMEN